MRLIGTVLAATLAIGALALAPAAARGDADPPSDVLLVQNVFYPYQPPVPAALQRTLNAEVAAAARAHFPIRVALVATPIDLGAIPQLFGHPQRYATFLEQEISFGGPSPLLVVMPAGYGIRGLKPAATALVPSLARPTDTAAGLAQAAIVAVRRLAGASGHPLPANAGPPAASGSGSDHVLLVVVVVLAAVALSSTVIAVRNRPRR